MSQVVVSAMTPTLTLTLPQLCGMAEVGLQGV